MLSVTYKPFMLSVTYKPFMLSVVAPNKLVCLSLDLGNIFQSIL
jgi:hypothetical protein